MSSVFYKKQRMNLSLGCSFFHINTPSGLNLPKRLVREQQRKAILVLKISLLSIGVGQTLIQVARRLRYTPSTLSSIALKHCPNLGRTLGIVLFVLWRPDRHGNSGLINGVNRGSSSTTVSHLVTIWVLDWDLWMFIVKGIYVTWTNDPPNLKIKDWNVTELKVQNLICHSRRGSYF